MKKPWLAALLNVIPLLGLGYWYVGRPRRSVVTFLGSILAAAAFVGILVGSIFLAVSVIGWEFICIWGPCRDMIPNWYGVLTLVLATVPMLLLIGFTAQDAWRLARKHDKAITQDPVAKVNGGTSP